MKAVDSRRLAYFDGLGRPPFDQLLLDRTCKDRPSL